MKIFWLIVFLSGLKVSAESSWFFQYSKMSWISNEVAVVRQFLPKTNDVWQELVLSWNAVCPTGTFIHAEAKGVGAAGDSPWYSMGYWSTDPTQKRESIIGQNDNWGEVETDTLVMRVPMQGFEIRLSLMGNALGNEFDLKFLGVSISKKNHPGGIQIPQLKKTPILAVPEKSQLGHVGGRGWCSPTCVSMVLSYWGKRLDRIELDSPVPEVAKAIHDPNWPGTGNWSFNVAFAGQFRGMFAFVHRMDSIATVHALVENGIPIPISVSFDLLNGKQADESNGHFVVVVGFDGKGNAVINDPWPDPKGINSVRKIVPVERLVKAWQRSKQTAYVIGPEKALEKFTSSFVIR
jgi:uncharacterized protein YvpB